MLDLIGIFKSVQAKKAHTNSHILKAGFTLIELSIVLVIIGLLLGGIIVGQDLIHAAQIRSVIGDTDKYKTAYNTFKEKYNCIPGDCINATAFFGAQTTPDAACAALDYTTPSTSSLTCNGDGNGQVGYGTYEMYRFWHHLANAGLIKGKYTGVSGSAGIYDHVLGSNAPSTALSNSGFSFYYFDFPTGNLWNYAMNYGNTFNLGLQKTNALVANPIFTPAEAQSFDTKIDDGFPGTGLVIAKLDPYWFSHANACSAAIFQLDYTGVYKTTHSTISCALYIKTGEH